MGNVCACDKAYHETESVDTPRAHMNSKEVFCVSSTAQDGMRGGCPSSADDTSSTVTLHLDQEEDLDSEASGEDEVSDMPYMPPSAYLGKRASVSAESYGEYNKRGAFKAPVFPKTSEQRARILKTISYSFLFSHLEDEDLNTIINAFQELKVAANVTIIRQGDDGDKLYLIETGEVNVYKRIAPNPEEQFMIKMVEGDAFGELALMYNAPRAATVKSITDMELWTLDRESFNHIVKDGAARKREEYDGFLKEVSVLKDMDPYERSKVADALIPQSFVGGDVIIQEGDAGDVFYILVEGEATAMKQGRIVMNYKKGDYFGELALIRNQPRAATVTAVGACKVISLHRKSFKRLLGPLEVILYRNTETYKSVCERLGLNTEYLDTAKGQA